MPATQVAFATNTAIGVRATTTIDDLQFPTGHPVLDTLRKGRQTYPQKDV
jgi:hypothetical protein